MPGCEFLAQQALERLDVVYDRLKAEGRLPAPNLVPPTVGDKAERGRQLGDWWAPPAPSWDPRAPGEPFPDPDSLKARPDALGAMFGRGLEDG